MGSKKYIQTVEKEMTQHGYEFLRQNGHIVYRHKVHHRFKVTISRTPLETTHALKLMRSDIKRNERMMSQVTRRPAPKKKMSPTRFVTPVLKKVA